MVVGGFIKKNNNLPRPTPQQLEQRRVLEEQRTRLIQEKAAEMALVRQSLQREKERDLAMVGSGGFAWWK